MDFAAAITSLPLPTLVFVLAAGMGRALGALFGLWGLYFILGPATILRTSLAVVLSLPMLVAAIPTFLDLTSDTFRLSLLIIPVREFVIGFGLGLLVSLPFFAILGAGILIDQYRGDFSPGLQAPESQQVGSFANLKVVMALFLFVEAGGFLILVTALYDSYALIPPQEVGFSFGPGFGALIGEVVSNVIWILVIVAMPIMLILMLIEFGVNVSFRLAGQIKVPSIDFLIKSLVFVAAMPILIFGIARSMERAFDLAPDPLPMLQELVAP